MSVCLLLVISVTSLVPVPAEHCALDGSTMTQEHFLTEQELLWNTVSVSCILCLPTS